MPMRRARFAVAAAVGATLALAAPAPARAECEIDREIFRCAEWQIEMLAPPEWDLAAQTSFPGILLYGLHRAGRGRMTLAAERVAAAMTVRDYAERNRQTLQRVGFKVSRLAPHATGAYVLEAVTPDGRRLVRQAYVVTGAVAYVLTFAAPRDMMPNYVRAFDDSLRSMTFLRRAAPASQPAAPASQPEAEAPPETP